MIDRLSRVRTADLFTRKHPTSPLGRLVQFPLVRVLVLVLFLFPAILSHNLIVIHGLERLESRWFEVGFGLLFPVDLLLWFFFYRLYTRWIEGRTALELSLDGAVTELLAGFGLAAAVVGVSLAALAVTGSYHVVGSESPWTLLYALCFFGSGAFVQVMIFRIVLYRLTEEWVGTWMAFLATGILFSLAHLGNENITPVAFLLFMLGDLPFLAAFALTRRLWLVWGFHTGWNFLQDGVLGMPNSGISSLPSFFEAEVTGPRWLSGGPFGIEASFLTTALALGFGIWMIVLIVKKGQVVPPAWRRP